VRGAAVVALIPLFVLAAATAQSPPNFSGTNEDPTAPHMIDTSGAQDESNYPIEAKRHGVEGWAMVNATVDENGRVTYVQITEISPADTSYGFAEAATKVATSIRFDNPRREPRQVKFRVKFDLKDKHVGDPPNLGGPRPAGG
jgi:TonB family protein